MKLVQSTLEAMTTFSLSKSDAFASGDMLCF